MTARADNGEFGEYPFPTSIQIRRGNCRKSFGAHGGKEMLGTYAMNRVAASAHLPTSWLFEPAKRPDDRADYCPWRDSEKLYYPETRFRLDWCFV